jgi:hypothetical protein
MEARMWEFEQLSNGQPERDPHESEFFNVGRLNYASALVRESVQNSLDAHDDGQVRVVFTLQNQTDFAISDYYTGLMEHLSAAKLLPFEFKDYKSIPYLCIEDFGTTGLDGPVDKAGNFFNFWWREGISEKGGKRAGRWGLGKTIYYVASNLRCYFGYTVRADNKEYLLGKAVLKTHEYARKKYHDYAYFNADGYEPKNDSVLLKKFIKSFMLERGKRKGLSVIIPAPKEGVTSNSLVGEAIIHYFFPIIQDKLIIEIKSGSKTISLTKETLCDVAREHDWEGTDWAGRSDNLESLLAFLEDAATIPENNMLKLSFTKNEFEISETIFGDNLEKLRECFNNGELLWIRVPVVIQPKDKKPKQSYFDVFLQKDDALQQPDEFYIRSGIRVPDIHTLGSRRVRALLTADHEYVASFLGDSESPAHTDWKERTEDFRKNYSHSAATLHFIKFSMRDMVRILDQRRAEKDTDLLKHIFYVPVGVEPSKIPPPPPPKPEKFLISKVSGGLRVSLAEKAITPKSIRLQVAYDTRRGNPFKRYSPMDFSLTSKNIQKNVVGGRILSFEGNTINVISDNTDFRLTITGFDETRDLRVNLKEVN